MCFFLSLDWEHEKSFTNRVPYSRFLSGQFCRYLSVSLGGEFEEDVAAVCGAEHERGGAHARLEGAAHLSARPHGRGLYCFIFMACSAVVRTCD